MRKYDGSRPAHIALYGQCGFGNFGNDATLELVLSSLRRSLPDARFTSVVRVPGVVEATLNVPSISFYPQPYFAPRDDNPVVRLFKRAVNEGVRIYQTIKFLRTVDYLVLAGGGRFDDFNSASMEAPYWKWKWVSFAKLLGVKVELVSIGAGPVDFGLSKWFYTRVAAAADRRSFRDEESRAYVQSVLGVDTSRDEITNDLVFAYPLPRSRPVAVPPRVIGVGVMEYNNRRGSKGGPDDEYLPYVEKLTAFCKGLLDRGLKIRILIGETCDMSTARDLWARLAALVPEKMADVMLSPAANMRGVLGQIADTDLVVATRFHNVVAALSMGRPVISLGYASKNARLMETFGLGAYSQSISDFSVDDLLAQVDDVSAKSMAQSAAIKVRAARLRAEMNKSLGQLAERIDAAMEAKAPKQELPAPPIALRRRARN
jgi:polysaccharide pyruvyl transferase WcaK-like protein